MYRIVRLYCKNRRTHLQQMRMNLDALNPTNAKRRFTTINFPVHQILGKKYYFLQLWIHRFFRRAGRGHAINWLFFHSGYLWRWLCFALIDNFLHLLLLDEDLFNNDEFATLQHHDELFTFSATTKTLILTVSIFHDTRWRETFRKWTYFDAKTIIGISIFVKHQKLKKIPFVDLAKRHELVFLKCG